MCLQVGDMYFQSQRRLWSQTASGSGVKTFGYLFNDPGARYLIPELVPGYVPGSLGGELLQLSLFGTTSDAKFSLPWVRNTLCSRRASRYNAIFSRSQCLYD
jgi:hypothetical protein